MFRRRSLVLLLLLLAPSLLGARCAFRVEKSGGIAEGEGGVDTTIVVVGQSASSAGSVALPAVESESPEQRMALLAPEASAMIRDSRPGVKRFAAPVVPEPKAALLFGAGALVVVLALRWRRRTRS